MANTLLFNLRIRTEQKEKLVKLSETEDRSVSQVIRLAIDSYLAGKGVK
jgi:hypothetical protein